MINCSQPNYHDNFKNNVYNGPMTFSILASDENSGTLAGACATGSLCVGGWVLRGALGAGLVASQGTAPSTLWRDAALARMQSGHAAEDVVRSITSNDPGRAHRQLTALDRSGGAGGFTGDQSVPWAGHILAPGLVVAGNMLANDAVLRALADAYASGTGAVPDRLWAALCAADRAGGDSRGLTSAALLYLAPDAPPLDLRIDRADDPLAALADLLGHARARPYSDWLEVVPVRDDPFRAPPAPVGSAGAKR